MAPPRRGHFVLHSNVLPPVTAGKYQLVSDQTGTPFDVEAERTHVTVSSPRYTMPPGQILSSFPPANGEGAWGDRLPQIVLKRRTLPWERNPAGSAAVSTTPWLALVVVAEGEAELSTPSPVEQCVTPGTSLLDPADRDVAEGVYLAVTETVVRKLFPTQEDLPLLVHVREVDVQDTELAAGDDDGWAAVVLANRLPVYDTAADRPVRYLACLVNLEGQLAALPAPVEHVDFFQFELAQDWTMLATSETHADQFVTGLSGTAAELVRGELDVAAAPAAPAVERERRLPSIGPALDGSATAAPHAEPAAAAWSLGPTEAVAAAALDPDAARVVRDTMGIGFRLPIEAVAKARERVLRFPVLAYWSFTTSDGATFETLMQDLDVGLLGTVPEPAPEAPPKPAGSEVVETGHVALEHRTRRGDSTSAWYRGALVPHPTDRDAPSDGRLPVAHSADQLRRVVPDGREDLSYAAAYEIGRLLALSQLSIVSALLRFRQEQFGAARVKHLVETLVPGALLPPLDDLFDLGHLVGTGLLDRVAAAPARVVGPSRPVADPGRPLELAGSLDTIVAEGLGLDLRALRKTAETVGMVAALAATDVPLVSFGDEPVREGPEVEAMGATLHAEIARLASLVAPSPVGGPRAPRAARGAAAPPTRDALDELIDRIPADEEED
ncbi:MAG TPA: hypothetical protein VLB86_04135 [Gaiellaceae bacterium]|nr:hypothetical protein [Gaiellaceae bacterium]